MGYAIRFREIVLPNQQVPTRPEPHLRIVENAKTRQPETRRINSHRSPVKVTTSIGQEFVFESYRTAWAQLKLPVNKYGRTLYSRKRSDGFVAIDDGRITYTFTFVELC